MRRPRPGAGPPRPAALPGGHVQGVDDEPRVAQVAGPRNKYQQSQGHRVTGGREGQGHGTERRQEEPWAGDAPSGPTRPRRTGTGSRVRMPAALTERREKLPHGDQPEEPPRQEEVCQLTPEDRAGRGGHERQRGQDPALRGGGHGEAGRGEGGTAAPRPPGAPSPSPRERTLLGEGPAPAAPVPQEGGVACYGTPGTGRSQHSAAPGALQPLAAAA